MSLSCIARGDRLKEAKTEAEAIIAEYRAELEANYQAALAKVLQLQVLYPYTFFKPIFYF